MKLTEQQQKNVESFLKTKGLKTKFPFLHQIISEEMLEDGTTYKYDCFGFCRELSEEQKERMKNLEESFSKYNLKVLFVLESVMQDPYGEKFHMDNYVYITDEDTKYGIELDPKTGEMRPVAHVHNKTYDESESGYILIKEVVGTMRRLG